MRSLMLLLVILASFPFVAAAHGDEDYPCTGLLFLDPFARPTVTPTGAAYGVLVNFGEDDLTLMGGEADFAEAVEIHEMRMDGETMMMNPLSDGVVIPQGSALVMEPGGYHVMFIGVKDAIAAEDELEIQLNFAELDEALTLSIFARSLDEDPMTTPEPDEHGHGEDHMMSGDVLAFGDCEELDFSELEWEFGHDDEEHSHLKLILDGDEFELPALRVEKMMSH